LRRSWANIQAKAKEDVANAEERAKSLKRDLKDAEVALQTLRSGGDTSCMTLTEMATLGDHLVSALAANRTFTKEMYDRLVVEAELKADAARGSICVVCQDVAADTAMGPCGHLCLCSSDAEKMKERSQGGAQGVLCPVCKQSVRTFLKIFNV
jgi:hypothetical protein